MWFKDLMRGGLKLFRDLSTMEPAPLMRGGAGSALNPAYKANQGMEVTQDPITGEYTMSRRGEEEGWFYNDKSSLADRLCGAWTMATPAILDKASGTITLMRDKSQASDDEFDFKTQSSTPGDSHSLVRVATSTSEKVSGVIVACANHASQEQIFIPMAESTELVFARIAWNQTYAGGDMSEGELVTLDSLGVVTPLGVAIWVDAENCPPHILSVGDDTVYGMQLIATAFDRGGEARDLYRAIAHAKIDESKRPYYGMLQDTYETIHVSVKLMATLGNEASAYKTTILTVPKDNIVKVSVDRSFAIHTTTFYWCQIVNTKPLVIGAITPAFTRNDIVADFVDTLKRDGSTWNCEGDSPTTAQSIAGYRKGAIDVQNYFTTGGKIIPLSERVHSVPVIINEDYTMLVRVLSVSESVPAIITGRKVWDTSLKPKVFYFTLRYANAQDGYPPPSSVKVGEDIVIHRVGEFNNSGTTGYEIHTSSADKCSWVAFITQSQVTNYARVAWNITIDGGDLSEGELVTMDEFGNITATGTAIWVDGTIYFPHLHSLGDNTVYEMTLIEPEVIRNGVTRDLYKVKSLEKNDMTKEPLYVRGLKVYPSGMMEVRFHTNFIGSENSTLLYTTIVGVQKPNICFARLDNEWSGEEGSFYWGRVSSTFPLIITAIEPVVATNTTRLFIDINLDNGTEWDCTGDAPTGQTISLYWAKE